MSETEPKVYRLQRVLQRGIAFYYYHEECKPNKPDLVELPIAGIAIRCVCAECNKPIHEMKEERHNMDDAHLHLLWTKLIKSADRRLFCKQPHGLTLLLEQGTPASTERLMLSWWLEGETMGAILGNRFVAADDLLELFSKATQAGLSISDVPLDEWKEEL